MANLLTGDFEAVLQVSEATFNRLLASMHQNAWREPELPSFPHSVGIRLGDAVTVDGVRGTAFAQVGVPRMELRHGSTDRFGMEVALRIRYLPDPETTPLPTYMKGTLQADYVLEEIEPSTPGWRHLARDHMWIRVDESSVSFTGTYDSDDWLAIVYDTLDPNELNPRVTAQLRAVLAHSFEASPHRMSSQFRPGAFMSLRESPGDVEGMPVGGTAVAVPMGIPTTDPPLGAIGSLEHVVLDGDDFAFAVSSKTIMDMVEPALSQIRAYTPTIPVSFGVVDTVYRTTVTASATWQASGSTATVAVHVDGVARSDAVVAPDINVTVDQPFTVEFDLGGQTLRVQAGSPQVSADDSIVPDSILHEIEVTVSQAVKAMADSAAASLQPSLDALTAGRDDFIRQLQTLSERASAKFFGAQFHPAGVVVRGKVTVAPRRDPVMAIVKIDDGHLSAYEAWIPGGRIDRLEWSWTGPGMGGSGGDPHRFVLTRPPGKDGQFREMQISSPVPGLDGSGEVVLMVYGKAVDVDSGGWYDVEVGASRRFGHDLRVGPGHVYLRDWMLEDAVTKGGGPRQPGPVEIGVIRIGGPTVLGSNTLVVFADADWRDTRAALVDGIAACQREDAGLLVVLLVPDGALSGGAVDRAELEAFADEVEAPMIVNEDVEGGWSHALAIPAGNGAPVWRLLDPGGGVLWVEDGPLEPEGLAAALDHHLAPSPPARPSVLQEDLDVMLQSGRAFSTLLDPPNQGRSSQPRWSTVRDVDVRAVAERVSFVRTAARSQGDLVERLRSEHGPRTLDQPDAIVVLDGADQEVADAVAADLGPGFTVVPDPDGSKARQLGVRVFPTTVSLGDVRLEQGVQVQ